MNDRRFLGLWRSPWQFLGELLGTASFFIGIGAWAFLGWASGYFG